ncbi:hypothetical protein IHV25_01160 [Phaeovibrio sulfidiphilus]|uniref:Uncharacterized protein n=1 Tax=Phaeovibrio sulfidiphilus TaxID=1220600 RepID=A0A8J6YKJ0_9PROT|nr:hypothetical protein [Phaeovibrio sulfidiphilus]MBE1236265.1 hypothetical protein [Phaeovibrio sulfidiphilus]
MSRDSSTLKQHLLLVACVLAAGLLIGSALEHAAKQTAAIGTPMVVPHSRDHVPSPQWGPVLLNSAGEWRTLN